MTIPGGCIYQNLPGGCIYQQVEQVALLAALVAFIRIVLLLSNSYFMLLIFGLYVYQKWLFLSSLTHTFIIFSSYQSLCWTGLAHLCCSFFSDALILKSHAQKIISGGNYLPYVNFFNWNVDWRFSSPDLPLPIQTSSAPL